ncbi:hypothetical protein NNL21_33015 [Paenibacillus mendelii]|nr:hypothetical protein [Paenibacillus mendelii]
MDKNNLAVPKLHKAKHERIRRPIRDIPHYNISKDNTQIRHGDKQANQ